MVEVTEFKRQLVKQERLLNNLAEQMKLPLLQIARLAELSQLDRVNSQVSLANIEVTAEGALKLLDNYLLSIKLAGMTGKLQLEPVSVSAALQSTAHELTKLAQQSDCELQLHLSGRYEPVMAHQAGLEAALICLGYAFIESQPKSENDTKPVIKLAAHRGKQGIVAGLFTGADDNFNATMYRRGRGLYGHAIQPLANFMASSGAGVFVADSLLTSMSAKLRVAHHQKFAGLAATLRPSKQMVLV